jgi:hypothetical protein
VYEHSTKSLIGKKEKIKMYFAECPELALGKECFASVRHETLGKDYLKILKPSLPVFAECLSAATRQRRICRVPDLGHSAKYFLN